MTGQSAIGQPGTGQPGIGPDRRTVLKGFGMGAAAVAAAGAGLGAAGTGTPAFAEPAGRAGRRVAIFGAGPGGLSAALELAERGFSVDVYERQQYLGGKCRSEEITGSGTGGRRDLPVESGPHGYWGTYQHWNETLSRVPNGRGGNLVDDIIGIGGADNSQLFWIGLSATDNGPFGGADPVGFMVSYLNAVPEQFARRLIVPHELPLVASKLVALMTSGLERQHAQLENVSVSGYFGPISSKSKELLELILAQVKVSADEASARTMVRNMMIFTAYLGTKGLGRGAKSMTGFLRGSANDTLFVPFEKHLRSLGVRFHRGHHLLKLEEGGGEVARAMVRDGSGATVAVTADYYVSAVPQDVFPRVIDAKLISRDPSLGRTDRLGEQWLGAAQLYVAGAPKLPWLSIATGPWQCVAFDWARTMPNFAKQFGDGRAHQWMSIDLQTWDTPGQLYGKTAREATREQFIDELLHCLGQADPSTWGELDRKRIVHSDVSNFLHYRQGAPVHNTEPLFGGVVGALAGQPDPVTRIDNLLLAATWTRTNGGIDAMDCACEAARRATNAILDRSGYRGRRAFVGSDQPGPGLKELWDEDDRRYRAGLPNRFDTLRPYRRR